MRTLVLNQISLSRLVFAALICCLGVTTSLASNNSNQALLTDSLCNVTALVDAMDETCFLACDGIAAAVADGGDGSYVFTWYDADFNVINNSNDEILTMLCPGDYVVVVIDDSLCTDTAVAVVGGPQAPLDVQYNSTDPLCKGSNDGTLSIAVSGGTAPYTASSVIKTQTYNVAIPKTLKASNLEAGSYTITVTDDNGCTEVDTIVLTDPPALNASAVVEPPSCFDGNDAFCQLTITGGTPGKGNPGDPLYRYSVNNGPIKNYNGPVSSHAVAPGTYVIKYADANMCMDTIIVVIPNTPPIQVTSFTSCLPFGVIDITVSGGTPPFSFLWSNSDTTEDLTNVDAGSYSVTITDDNGCIKTETFVLNCPPRIPNCQDLTATIPCADSTQKVTVNPVGGIPPYTFEWSDGQTTQTATGLVAGSYSVTVTDANSLTDSCDFTIFPPPNPLMGADLIGDVLGCEVSSTFQASASSLFTGGTPPFSYLWSTGDTTETITFDFGASVTVTDSNGCTAMGSVSYAVFSDTLEITASGTSAQCIGDSTGSATVTVTKGSATSILWSTGESTPTITGLLPGTYSVTVTSLYCTDSAMVTISGSIDSVPPTAICKDVSLKLDTAGFAKVTVSQVDNGSTDDCGIDTMYIDIEKFDCDDKGQNTVTLTVVDVNGNASTCTSKVTISDNIPPMAICKNIILKLDSTGQASILGADIDGGSKDNCGVFKLLTNPTPFTCADLGLNNRTLVALDFSNNSSTCVAEITVVENIPPVPVCSNFTTKLDSAGKAQIQVGFVDGGSTDNCAIDTMYIDKDMFTCLDVGPNTVTLTVVDKSGNVATCTSTVTIDDNYPPIANCKDANIKLDASGKVSITTLDINDGSTDACGIDTMYLDITEFDCDDIGSNTVTLTVTDVNGNTSTCTAKVNVADNLPPTALCADISVKLDSNGIVIIGAAMINNGSTDNCGIDTITIEQTSYVCSDVGLNTATLTVTDNSGNTATCTGDVTVLDNTPPVAVCQDITVKLDSSGKAAIVTAMINNGSTDNCAIDTMYLDIYDFDCNDIGANTVTLTVIDKSGNVATCTSTVTIDDNYPPIANCKDANIKLDASGKVSITTLDINDGSTDACGIDTMYLDITEFDCDDIGSNTVTLTVTDNNGNTSSCTALVTVDDNTPPTAICQNIDVKLDATGNVSITAMQINNGSSDACGIDTMYLDKDKFTCLDIGANTVTLIVEDVNGNSAPCTATVTVSDNTPPTALCDDISVKLDIQGFASIVTGMIDDGSNDACGIDTVFLDIYTFDCQDLGANTVTLTAVDVNGNSATCTATVTVDDNTPPTALCNDINVKLDATGSVSITTAQINNGSSDACGIDTMYLDIDKFDCSDVGANTVILTVEDINGNTATCTSTVTVSDNTPPMAKCQDISVKIDGLGKAGIMAAQINDSSSDACGIDTIYLDITAFTCLNIGPNTVTLTVVDVNGNSSTCTATVTVDDNLPPIVNCNDVSLKLDSAGIAVVSIAQISNGTTDNCGIDTLYLDKDKFTCADTGQNLVTLNVEDINGNTGTCTAKVTVSDNLPPVAICKDITVKLDANGMAAISGADIDGGSTDNCGVVKVITNPTPFTCADLGMNTKTLVVLDAANNSSTCVAKILVEENVPPVAVCQDITVKLDSSGKAAIVTAMINNGSTDNCAIDTMYLDIYDFDCNDIGANTVTLTVIDKSGNVATCTSTVTIDDNYPPIANCKDANIKLDASGKVSITTLDINDGSTDACGIDTMYLDITEFDCDDIGSNTVTLTVTDVNGNTSTCTAKVNVADNLPPTALCADISVKLDSNGIVIIGAAMINNGSTDNCGIDTITIEQTSYVCSDVGLNTATLTVTDNSGNTATCTGDVTVLDNTPPVAVCQDITVKLDSSGKAAIVTAMINNGSTDNCAIDTMYLDIYDFDCNDIGANTVTLTVIDKSGNVATCTSTVTIDDNYPPIANCKDANIKLDASGKVSITTLDINDGSTDACGIDTMYLDITEFDCDDIGSNTVTLTVTDNNGNTSSCTALVTVDDNTPPTAICQNIDVKLDATGNVSITAMQINNGSSDACGIDTMYLDKDKFTCLDIGANTVTLIVEDVNGNSAPCTATVTVSDNTPPTALCDDISVKLDIQGFASIVTGMIDDGSNDACGIDTVFLDIYTFDCQDLGANTVTLTAVDVNGNSATCTATVTVDDNTPPTALCNDINVKLDATGSVSITTAQINNGSSDACGIDTMYLDIDKFDCSDVGANTVILTVEDINGNTATCTSTVTVSDNTPPMAKCFDLPVKLDAQGNAVILVSQINDGSSDACGIDTLYLDNDNFDCSDVGVNTVTLTVTDVNGNTSTCTSSVTVSDNTPPAAMCSNISVKLDSAGKATITTMMVNNGSSDACGIDTMYLDKYTFTCADTGNNSVTLTVTDVNGNTATCSSKVDVSDNMPPVAICKDITVKLDANGQAMIVGSDIDGGSTDNCGVVKLVTNPTPYTCADLGVKQATLVVLDAANNAGTCVAKVTIEENVPPVPVCQNITVKLDSSGKAAIVTAQIDNGSTDNCAIDTMYLDIYDFDCNDIGANTVTLTVIDKSGNVASCTAIVTIENNIPPTARCKDANVKLDASGKVSITTMDINDGSTDACGIDTMYLDITEFDCDDIGSNTVTLTVTDINGNTSTCTSKVNVADNLPPTALCADISVKLDSNGIVIIGAALINNGSTDNCGIDTITIEQTTYTCADVGLNTATLTVTDNSGNMATCTADVTVLDNTPPVALCQDIAVKLDATGNVSISTAMINNGSSDACGLDTMYLDRDKFTCLDVGSNTVTLTVKDVNGNSSTCTADVTVSDNTPPVALCMNMAVKLDGQGLAMISANQVNANSTDACGIDTFYLDNDKFDCDDIGANLVTLTVKDVNGNVSTCTATITVSDNTPPTPNCMNLMVKLDATGSAMISALQVGFASTDACGIDTLYLDNDKFDCSDIGSNTVTLTVVDVNGNSATCTADVNVSDNTPPMAKCQDISIKLNNQGFASITASDIDNGSSDACGLDTLYLDIYDFDCQDLGINTVTLTATDINGNSATCSADVTVSDNTPPMANCADINVKLDATGNVTILVGQIDDDSGDNCGIDTSYLDIDKFTCADVGANTVTLTVVDVNGNASSCTATVTVDDNTPPTAICQDISVKLNDQGFVSITTAQINNGSSDACGIDSMYLDNDKFDCSDIGANTVTLFVKDINGNIAPCTATVTVSDNTPPVVLCNNITVKLDSAGKAKISTSQISNGSSDACGIDTMYLDKYMFTCADSGSNIVTLTVVDVNGNAGTCSAKIEVEDNLPPVAICKNITIKLDASGTATITGDDIDGGSYDNCGLEKVITNPTPFTCADLGQNMRTLVAIDFAGNATTCQAKITVEENIPPVPLCQNITVKLDSQGKVSIITAQIDNGSSDNCGIDTMYLDKYDFDCSDIGLNTVTLTVIDLSGNVASCTATVTVDNNIPPTAKCQDISVKLDASGKALISTMDINNGSTDACGIDTMYLDITEFDCSDLGLNTVTLTVVDVNGNVSSCTADVTVNDNTPPMAKCQDVSVKLDAQGFASISTSMVDNGSTDNCAVDTMALDKDKFDCSDVGINTVTLTVWDASGNSASCTAEVTVSDNIPPMAQCKDITVYVDPSFITFITPLQVDNGSSDNCAVDTSFLTREAFFCFDLGLFPTTDLIVVDVNGNTDTCTSVVTVLDTTAPAPICDDITVKLSNKGFASVVAQQIAANIIEGCGIDTAYTDITDFDCSDIGANTVNVTVVDRSGNTGTCSATVTVIDNVPPQALCGPATELLTNGSFETGDFTGWNTIDLGNAFCTPWSVTPVYSCGFGFPALLPSEGGFLAGNGFDGLGGTVDSSSFELSQVVSIPADNKASLSWDHNISWDFSFSPFGASVPREFIVELQDTGTGAVITTLFSFSTDTGLTSGATGWVKNNYDLSAYAGQTVRLVFKEFIPEQFTGPGQFAIDNISLLATPVTVAPFYLDQFDLVTLTVSDIDNGSNDECGIDTLYLDRYTFDCKDPDTNSVTLTVVDVNGNVSSCTQLISIIDTIPPTALCNDISVKLDNQGFVAISTSMIDGGSDDACGIDTAYLDIYSFDCSDLGVNTVTLTVVDVNGNANTCTSDVTVSDNTPPTAQCQDISIKLDAAGYVTILAAQIDDNSTDNCGIDTLYLDKDKFDCTNVGANTVTLTVVDLNGNAATCSATVTVDDNTPPSAQCQDISVKLDAQGYVTIFASMVDDGSNDACGIDTLYLDKDKFDCADVGINKVNLTVTDVNGNSSTCSANVTVSDNVPPTAKCQNIDVKVDAQGIVTLTTSMVDNGSNDACGIDTLYLDKYIFDCADTGSNTVTLTAVDVNGNSADCLAKVDIEDNLPPVAVCKDITVKLGQNGMVVIDGSDIDDGSYDNCGVLKLVANPTPFTCADIGVNNKFLIALDAAGNSSTCISKITILDNLPPDPICNDISVKLDTAGMATITVSQIDGGSSDNCALDTLFLDKYKFDCADVGTNKVTLTAVDESGNSATCSAIVTIVNNGPSIVDCKDASVKLDASGMAMITASAISNGTSIDACGLGADTTYVMPDKFTCADIGVKTVTLAVIDLTGNMLTCTADVTISDNMPPMAKCQDVSVKLDAQGFVSISTSMVNNGSTDNCAIDTMMLDKDKFDCTDLGLNTVTLTVYDASGNSASCTAEVTVSDNTPPMVNCIDIKVTPSSSGVAIITASDISSSSDNCGVDSMAIDKDKFTCADDGPNTVTVTVWDASGNSSSCTSTVTVNGVPPTISANITDPTCEGATDGMIMLKLTGGSGSSYTFVWSTGDTTQNLANLGAGMYSVTVTIDGGCTTSDTFKVEQPDSIMLTTITTDNVCYDDCMGTIEVFVTGCTAPYSYAWSSGDTTARVYDLCAGIYTVTVTDANGFTAVATDTVSQPDSIVLTTTATDNDCYDDCDGTIEVFATGGTAPFTYSWSNGDATAKTENLCAGVYTVTVTDANGCTSSATDTVDQPDPIMLTTMATDNDCYDDCHGTIEVFATGGTAPFTYSWSNGDATAKTENLCAGIYTVTVTDANGCTAVATDTVDQPDPIVLTTIATDNDCFDDCNGTIEVFATGGKAPYTYSWSNGDAIAKTENLCAGIYTVTVTDANGCTSVATDTVDQPDPLVVTTTVTLSGCSETMIQCPELLLNQNCDCDGKMQEVTVVYQGINSTVNVKDDGGNIILTFNNVSTGDTLVATSSNAGLNDFGTKTFWNDGNGDFEIHTSCSQDILYQTYGNFYVIGFVDGAGNSCGLPNSFSSLTLFDNGCGCDGKMTEVTFVYDLNGVPNSTVDVYDDHQDLQYTLTNVQPGDEITVTAASFGESDLNSKIFIAVNGGSLGEIHTSCSRDILGTIVSDMLITGYVDGEGEVCDALDCSPTFITPTTNCDCDGKMQEVTVVYNGSSSSVDVKDKDGTVILTFNNVNTGDTLIATSSSAGLNEFGSKTFWNDGSGDFEIHTSCSQDILYQTYGSFFVIGFVDGAGNSCGGSNPFSSVMLIETDCPCDGKMTAVDVVYDPSGPANGTIDVYDDGHSFLYSVNNVQPGDKVMLTSAMGGLSDFGTKFFIKVNGSGFGEIHTSCSRDIIGMLVNGVLVTGYTDGNSNVCDGLIQMSCPAYTVTVSASGGTPPYSYNWSTGSTDTLISDTICSSTTFTVTVTDANGCTEVDTADLNIDNPIAVTISGIDVDCNGNLTGEATAFASGGTAPYTYAWSNGANTPCIKNVAAGMYSVTVTDSKGCEGTASVTIHQPQLLVASISTSSDDCTMCSSTATVSATGGNGGNTFLWNTGATTESISGLCAGNYSVTVTDSLGCTAIVSVTVSDPDPLHLMVSATGDGCGGGNKTTTCDVTNITSNSRVFWLPSFLNPNKYYAADGATGLKLEEFNDGTAHFYGKIINIGNSANGFDVDLWFKDKKNYTDWIAGGGAVKTFDATNDPTTWNFYVFDNSKPNTLTGFGALAGELLNLTDKAGMSYGVQIGFGANDKTFTYGISTWFDYTGTSKGTGDINGDLDNCITTTPGGCAGTATVNASGGSGNYSYIWSDGQTTQTATGLCAGSYSVTVSDSLGCFDTTSAVISGPGQLNISKTSTNVSCDSATACNPSTVIEWDLEACAAGSKYSEFFATTINSTGFAKLTATNIYRSTGNHSCTPGVNGGTGMCVGTDSKCTFDDDDPYALRFKVNIGPNGGDAAQITALNFFEQAPKHYVWTSGGTGSNDYPTKYGIRVLRDGVEVFKQTDIPTSSSWTLQSFDFTSDPDFTVASGSAEFSFELRAYCRINNGAKTSVWDLDNFSIDACNGSQSTKVCDGSIALSVAGGSGSYSYQWLGGASTSGSTSKQIDASNNDAEENPSTGSSSISGNYHSMGTETIGLRFDKMNIPDNAIITNAYIEFRSTQDNSGNASLLIEGEDVDYSSVFNGSNYDISGRTKTSASVAWNPIAWYEYKTYNSPDISNVVQEIVDRSGWNSGNPITVIVSGTGEREAKTYDNYASKAPILHIDYTVPGGTFNGPNASDLCAGEYCVIVTDDISGCSDSLCVTIGEDTCTSKATSRMAQDAGNTLQVVAYPNPTQGVLNVEVQASAGNASTVRVYDLLGSVVYELTLDANTFNRTQIDLSRMVAGVYMLEVISDNEKVVKQVILSNN